MKDLDIFAPSYFIIGAFNVYDYLFIRKVATVSSYLV